MTSTTPEATAVRCAYPGCENEPRAAEDTAGAKPKYCEQPDPVTGKPHSALTAFRRRQELRQAAGAGGTTTDADTEQPVTMARATGADLLQGNARPGRQTGRSHRPADAGCGHPRRHRARSRQRSSRRPRGRRAGARPSPRPRPPTPKSAPPRPTSPAPRPTRRPRRRTRAGRPRRPERREAHDRLSRGHRRARRRARADPRGDPGPHHHRRGRPGQRDRAARGRGGRAIRRPGRRRRRGERRRDPDRRDRAPGAGTETEPGTHRRRRPSSAPPRPTATRRASRPSSTGRPPQAAEQRAAAAEARADDARAETARVREDAARRSRASSRADDEREREEILARLTDTASRLAEVTRTHAAELEQAQGRRGPRARRAAERTGSPRPGPRGVARASCAPAPSAPSTSWTATRSELARIRQDTGTTDASARPRGQSTE